MKTISPITHEEIAARAYKIWEDNGRPDGLDTDYWLRAEHELQQEREQAEEGAGAGESMAGLAAPKNGSAKSRRPTGASRAPVG